MLYVVTFERFHIPVRAEFKIDVFAYLYAGEVRELPGVRNVEVERKETK